MATLTGKQLKDSYQSLVTIKDADDANPTSGQLENGLGNALTAVGIGTDSPDAFLHIGGSIPTSAESLNVRGNSSSTYVVSIEQDNSTGYGVLIDTDGTLVSEPALNVQNSSSSMLWVGSNGNVGIGTSSPTVTLEVDGELRVSSATARLVNGSGESKFIIDSATDSDAIIQFKESGGNRFTIGVDGSDADKFKFGVLSDLTTTTALTIDSSGNVGIGETSPSSELHIKSATGNVGIQIETGDSSDTYINFGDSADSNVGLIVYEHDNNAFAFRTNAQERLRIDSSGKVGIGASSLFEKFTLREAGATDLFMQYLNNSDSKVAYSGLTSGGRYYLATNDEISFHSGVSYTERLRIDSSGNVTLQTVGAQLRFQNSLGPAPYIENSGEDASTAPYGQDLLFATGGSESMRIDSSGKVGISSISPDATLTLGSNSVTGDTMRIKMHRGGSTSQYTELKYAGNFVVNGSGNDLVMQREGSEVARFTSDGLCFGGDFATANALDDYEEGTWTPALNAFNLGDGTSTGLYTKIGNLVTIQFSIVLGSTSVMGNATTISGLPFTSSNFLSGYVDILDSGTKQFSMVASSYSSGTNFSIRGLRSDTTYVESFTISATTPMTWTTGDSIIGQLFYRVA